MHVCEAGKRAHTREQKPHIMSEINFWPRHPNIFSYGKYFIHRKRWILICTTYRAMHRIGAEVMENRKYISQINAIPFNLNHLFTKLLIYYFTVFSQDTAYSSETTKMKPVNIAGLRPKNRLLHISHFSETFYMHIFL